MTHDRMARMEALQKADDGNFLRSLAETVLQILMEADVEGVIGAGRYERSGERSTWRNGYRDRSLGTRLGQLNLRIPKLRTGSYFPPFLEARKTTEKALISVIQEAWIAGVSTRKVDDLVQAMGLSAISKSQVSKLCKEIDERVGAFLKRPLDGDAITLPDRAIDVTEMRRVARSRSGSGSESSLNQARAPSAAIRIEIAIRLTHIGRAALGCAMEPADDMGSLRVERALEGLSVACRAIDGMRAVGALALVGQIGDVAFGDMQVTGGIGIARHHHLRLIRSHGHLAGAGENGDGGRGPHEPPASGDKAFEMVPQRIHG
jgi:hypothetical protein